MKRKRDDEAPLSEAALNVLVLGDGNLSYSLALAQRLPNAKVLATSYDGSEEVRAKYADTNAIVGRLQALGPRVRVRHGVDALAIAATLECDADGQGKEEGMAGMGRFDHIVFNHPHTGWEDMHRHAALLAHFLHSCKDEGVLNESEGQVHITLAGEQPARWRLLETARRLGFHLRHVCDFYRQFGPDPLPSEIKRHQSGKSFRLRGLPSYTFTFSLSAHATSPILWRHAYEDHAAVLLLQQPGKGSVLLPQGAVTDVARPLQCGECNKRFRGPKDLQKHVRRAHEEREEADVEAAELVCNPCGGRVFKDWTALEQHRRAKHEGLFQDLKPDWAQAAGAEKQQPPSASMGGGGGGDKGGIVEGSGRGGGDNAGARWQQQLRFKGKDAEAFAALLASDPAAPAATYSLCEVCGYQVPIDVDHLGDLRPPARPTFKCMGCERTFHEERALKQHANACAAFLRQLRARHHQQQQQQHEQLATPRAAAAASVAAKA